MLRKLLYRLTANRPARLIKRDDHPYLERYFMGRVLGITVYLHRFVGTDPDEGAHNHPWNALAICLAGGYKEARVTTLCPIDGWQQRYRFIRPCSFNRIRVSDFHQIVEMKPDTWTLFIHGRYRAGWGFLRKVVCSYGLDTHGLRTEFHQPYPLTSGSSTPWWMRSPKGSDVGREPLYEG